MTDIEHAKKYAKESISLAISMYNPKAEIIAETACLYGLTYKNKQIADLEQKLEQTEKDLSDYQFNYPTIKELQKENADLKARLSAINSLTPELEKSSRLKKQQLTKAKELLEKWIFFCGGTKDFKSPLQEETEVFLKENK